MADLKKQINTQIQATRTQAGYGMSLIAKHKHTGLDAPKVSYNDLTDLPTSGSGTFAGSLNADASVNFLPTGWTASVGTGGQVGVYTITHNLGTTSYAVVYTILGTFHITIANLESVGANSFKLVFYTQTGGISWSNADTPFNFILAMN